MASRRLMSLIIVLAITSLTNATLCNLNGHWADVDYWAGSGSNEAVVVIDFGTDSYAFGYRWDVGTKYGKDLMDAVDLAGTMNYTQSYGFLNTISYDTYSNVGKDDYPTDWWVYFICGDGVNWVDSPVGFADRVLSNGCWDAWAHQTTGDWPPTHWPTAPIPEPCTIALFGLGGLLRAKRKA